MTPTAHLWAIGYDDMASVDQVGKEITQLAWGLPSETSVFLTIQQFLAARGSINPVSLRWHNACPSTRADVSIQGDWNMKIEKASQGGKTTVRLSGHFQAEHIGELKKQLQNHGPRLVLDLMEVTVVDVEVVRFLGACEAKRMKIVHCPQYIREWIYREREP